MLVLFALGSTWFLLDQLVAYYQVEPTNLELETLPTMPDDYHAILPSTCSFAFLSDAAVQLSTYLLFQIRTTNQTRVMLPLQ